MRADQAAKPLDAFIDHLVIGAGIAKAQRIRTGSVGKERLARNECHLFTVDGSGQQRKRRPCLPAV